MSKPDTVPFTVTLPAQVVKTIEALIPEGLHGATRAEVARTLIFDQLKLLKSQTVTITSAPPAANTPSTPDLPDETKPA